MTTICYGWQVRKLPYMEVFEHFANNLWSHCHIWKFLNILPITCGHTVHGTSHCFWYGIAPTTVIYECN